MEVILLSFYLHNITKNYEDLKVLDGINLNVERLKINCILGPSGCGKTTLLKLISGILEPDEGCIEKIKGEISYIFQEDNLIPWKTVYDNIDFVLKNKLKSSERKIIINTYLENLDMKEYSHFYPSKLSGGMRQKVSIGRAFAYNSELLIMDEPFKSLDLNSKNIIIKDFLKLQKLYPKTVILVTHDVEEACILGDRIFILSNKPTKIKKEIINTTKLENSIENSQDFKSLKEEIESLLIL